MSRLTLRYINPMRTDYNLACSILLQNLSEDNFDRYTFLWAAMLINYRHAYPHEKYLDGVLQIFLGNGVNQKFFEMLYPYLWRDLNQLCPLFDTNGYRPFFDTLFYHYVREYEMLRELDE